MSRPSGTNIAIAIAVLTFAGLWAIPLLDGWLGSGDGEARPTTIVIFSSSWSVESTEGDLAWYEEVTRRRTGESVQDVVARHRVRVTEARRSGPSTRGLEQEPVGVEADSDLAGAVIAGRGEDGAHHTACVTHVPGVSLSTWAHDCRVLHDRMVVEFGIAAPATGTMIDGSGAGMDSDG